MAPVLGIIPADAGNTMALILGFALIWDHPRGCGEHCAVEVHGGAVKGSSPRMRGTPAALDSLGQIPRIIPADAGNTSPGT